MSLNAFMALYSKICKNCEPGSQDCEPGSQNCEPGSQNCEPGSQNRIVNQTALHPLIDQLTRKG